MDLIDQDKYHVVGIAALIVGLGSVFWFVVAIYDPSFKAWLAGDYASLYKTYSSGIIFAQLKQVVLILMGMAGLMMVVGGTDYVNNNRSPWLLWAKWLGLMPMIVFVVSGAYGYALRPLLTALYAGGDATQRMSIVISHPFLGNLDPKFIVTAIGLGIWVVAISLVMTCKPNQYPRYLGFLGILWAVVMFVNTIIIQLPTVVGQINWILQIIWYFWFALVLYQHKAKTE